MARYFTPIRYPGGKQKLFPFIEEIITTNDLTGCHYSEPFAGGAGIAIELLVRNIVSSIHLNDINPGVFSFWHSVKKYPEELCRKISLTSLTIEEWTRQREIFRRQDKGDRLELGFAFLYLNRCNRSGILTGGVIGGLKQDGPWKMDARFSRKDIINRIELIAAQKSKIHVYNLDAEEFITTKVTQMPSKSLIYLDPPYINKSERLYYNAYSENNHLSLSDAITSSIQQSWVVSYDNVRKIQDYYSKYRKIAYALHYNAAKSYSGSELFIFSHNLEIPRSSRVSYVNNALLAYY